MAQLVVGAVGAAIGFAVGGPTGAYYGWAIGTTIGGIAFAPKMPGIEGPRLNDLKAQKSNYGIPIPIVYGAMRAAGNVIWATDLVETSTTTGGGGGKGDGGGGQEQTTYSYSQSFAVGLCEGTIVGVRRIWANGKMIYNLSDTADNATIIASNNAASGIRFYNGSETQMPDSLIQAHVGAANTPAFRGLAYVVFESMQLADYGNRAPNLEFEVVIDGSVAYLAGSEVKYTSGLSPYGICFDNVTNSVWVANSGDGTISKILITTGSIIHYPVNTNPSIVIFDNVTNSVWVSYYYQTIISKIDITSGSRVDYDILIEPASISFDSITNSIWATDILGFVITKIDIYDGSKTDYIMSCETPTSISIDNVTNSVWVTDFTNMTITKFDVFSGFEVAIYPINGLASFSCFDSVTNSIWISYGNSTYISKFDVFSGSIIDYTVGYGPNGICFDNVTNSVWVANFYDNTVSKVNVYNGSSISYSVGTSPFGSCFDNVTNSVWITNSFDNDVSKIAIQDYGISSGTYPSLSSITTDICSRVGLTAADINVSELTDLVPGYMVQRGTARSWLEQLMQAYYFDAVESDGKIKFVKRGGASVISIPEDDLAAHEYNSAPPDTLVTTRRQEMELPVEVAVQYMDVDAAYAVGSQLSQRLTTESDNKIGINLAISMSASKAKQISDVLMYDAWTSRTSFDAQTAWKYSYLEPTDIVTISKGGRTYTARITSEDASGGIYNRSLVLEDSSIYTQSASAPSMPTPTDTVSLTPLTNLLMLDIPLLRDQDDGYGFYAAACGYGAGWRGAQAFKSNDAGATWSSFGDPLINEASIGSTSTALGNFTGGNIFDETNTVTVVLMRGSLSSDTEINILNGSNAALIGNEIVQFKTATLTATDTYQLSGLLRGRRGTEWAMTTHAIGDRFVLLSTATTYLFYGPSSEFDVLRKYKGVSFGNYLANAQSKDFTHGAVALIPYAPVLLGGGRNAALDVVLTWTRRTRIAGGWNNYSDVPIGETIEAYEVEIYDATYTTLKRTITGLTTNTTTYTAAQQVADFGSTQSVVYFKTYQISAIVGRGYESRGTA